MNITKYIGEQFGKPTGIGGKISTFIMNRMNQKQYRGVINELGACPKDKILDIGFGNGYLINKLATENSGKYYGIEISEDMIKIASKRNHQHIQTKKVTLEKGDALNMDFKDEFFDKVYTVNTVYFWSDLSKGLSEVSRVLKPNGIFINAIYSKEFLDKIRYTKYGFSKYTPKEIEEVALLNGFNVVKTIETKLDSSYCIILQKI